MAGDPGCDGEPLPAGLENVMSFNLNIGDDQQQADAESKRFVDEYDSFDWPAWKADGWTAYGSPQGGIDQMCAFESAGAKMMVVRLASYHQSTQLTYSLSNVVRHL